MAEAFWTELPVELSMALAKDPVAMNYFNGLAPAEQNAFVEKARTLHSGEELQAHIDSLHGYIG